MEYNFRKIEEHWQQHWKKSGAYKVSNESAKPPYYVLDMFPYPSGTGLHVGHPLGYIASDIYSRYKRLKGFNVLHPMGFDSFGLPAEQYALETGQHPATTTEKNIATFKSQLDKIGFCYDWSREVRTSDPNYYRWTQWIFLQLFNSYFCNTDKIALPITALVKKYSTKGAMPANGQPIPGKHFTADQWNAYSKKEQEEILMKRRLAYSSYGEVNWCEALGTVLANDEVVNGMSERGGHPVVKKKMRQWYLRITAYADRLLEGLDSLDFSDSMKEMQKNWIGKSEGAEVRFKVFSSELEVNVYTTRPDTISGADFLVLAPEHELVQSITTAEQRQAIDEYLAYVKSRSDRERMAEVKQITGCFTGAYAVNPFNGKQIPIWIAEYVLAGYGTGAIMAVPCSDQRDFLFAKHFNISITNIIGEHFNGEEANPTKEAILQNSGFLDGLLMKEAIGIAIDKILELGIGKRKVNYRMRDAGFSRQRYWGEPFPIIWKNGIAYPMDEKDLPLELPHIEKYGPGPEGEGPLANVKEWTSSPSLLHRMEKGDGKIAAKNLAKGAALVPKYKAGTPMLFELAKQMRKEYTDAENHLWQQLRANKLGVKFRRQHPIESYIADFICLQHGLIVEVDGGYHETAEQKIYDEERTRVLNEIGFNIIRFSNDEVLNDIEKVIIKIKEETSSPSLLHGVEKGDEKNLAKNEASGTFLRTDTFKENIKNTEFSHLSPLAEEGQGVRETSTMPGYAGSSWYFLRYMDPNNNKTFCDRKASDYWGQVDVYIGGTEHAVGHLLYSRMWTKVLYDLGLIGFDEPFKKLVNQGMITGKSYFFNSDSELVITSYDKNKPGIVFTRFRYGHQFVDSNGKLTRNNFEESNSDIPNIILWDKDNEGEYIMLKEESEKMSKSKFNVDSPDDIVDKYGADTFRMYEMFLGPVEQSKPWDTKGIEGVHRFLRKLWRLFNDDINEEKATDAELKVLHKTIKKIEYDTEHFSFNTAVSAFMVAVNELGDLKSHKREILEPLLILLVPYAPHIAEELWQQLGNSGSILDATFPKHDEKYLIETSKEYPVSVNGKLRTAINISLDAAQPEVEKIVLANEVIQKWLEGKPPKKIIFVKGKMINVVI